jgi:[acyl-carrier-protein] S-malonyltransferase
VLAVVGDRFQPVGAAAGHSLGEYSAYVAAGSLSAVDGARLVRRRGQLMQEAGTRRVGAMAAVVGLPGPEVERICRDVTADGRGTVVAANLNEPAQTVVSGDPEAVAAARARCTAAGARKVVPLKVSGAFHSPLMAPAVPGLRQALGQVEFRPPRFPVFCNATARPVDTAPAAVEMLAEQLTAPVRWVELVQGMGERFGEDAAFLEVGPGTVLGGLVKKILPGARCLSLGTAAEVERFLA